MKLCVVTWPCGGSYMFGAHSKSHTHVQGESERGVHVHVTRHKARAHGSRRSSNGDVNFATALLFQRTHV